VPGRVNAERDLGGRFGEHAQAGIEAAGFQGQLVGTLPGLLLPGYVNGKQEQAQGLVVVVVERLQGQVEVARRGRATARVGQGQRVGFGHVRPPRGIHLPHHFQQIRR
jgi:hypothetical protein